MCSDLPIPTQEEGHRDRLCQLLLMLLRRLLQRTLPAALSEVVNQIHWPDEWIYKNPKTKPGKRSHFVRLGKLVLERPDCEIPHHVVSVISPSTHTSFETTQSSDRWGDTWETL